MSAGRRLVVSTGITLIGLLAGWVSVQLGAALYTTFILFGSAVAAIAVGVRPLWLLALLAIPAAYVSGCAASYAANSLRLSAFASQLEADLPGGSAVLDAERRIEIFLGNGNHCDYLARIRIQAPLSREQIEEYYARFWLTPAIPGGDGVMPKITVSEVEQGRYDVTLIDGPYSRNLDLRCT